MRPPSTWAIAIWSRNREGVRFVGDGQLTRPLPRFAVDEVARLLGVSPARMVKNCYSKVYGDWS